MCVAKRHVKRASGFITGCISNFIFRKHIFTPNIISAGLIVISASVDLILVLRVYALYENSKRAQLAALLFHELLTATTESNSAYLDPQFGCGFTTSSIYVKLQNIYLGLLLAFHENGGLRNYFQNEFESFRPLLITIMRDVSTIVLVLGGVQELVDPTAILGSAVAPYYFAILSFTGPKLILKLRKMSDLRGENSDPATTYHSIFFARSGPERRSGNSEDTNYDESLDVWA
ncbi:hypothetical protein BDQ17DRAFT_1413706 [Cyathus striatus]|nr:hypothetical protein BDQ17DRAFT_1413706 [Cyathus striatus]